MGVIVCVGTTVGVCVLVDLAVRDSAGLAVRVAICVGLEVAVWDELTQVVRYRVSDIL